jgi:hypothetical protein
LKDERWTVDYPDEQTMKSEIQFIVSSGLVKPKKFHEYLLEMYRQLGFRYLFRDATEIIFTMLIASAAMVFGLFQVMEGAMEADRLYSYLFIMSPILYMLVAVLFLVNLRSRDTFAVEMTCKYHVFQLAAFRMLVFSILAILLNIASILILFLFYQSFSIVEAVLISISSLGVFSTMFLYIIQKVKSRVAGYAAVAGWVLANVALAYFNSELYDAVLSQIPVYVYIAVSVGCLVLYVRRLKVFITLRNVEEVL